MVRVAVVVMDSEEVTVWPVPAPPVQGALAELGLAPGGEPGSYAGGWWLLEPLCSLLDRHGYRWAADTANGPRTWAERMFAETPDHLAEGLHAAVRQTLERAGEDGEDHLAVLDWAWRWHGGRRQP